MDDLSTPTISIDKIEVPEGFNPRTSMDTDALDSLAGSIDTLGVLQPLTVRANGKDGSYVLVAGERRLRAARIAGKKEVPVHIQTNGGASRAAALAENIHREDLDPIDTAKAIKAIAAELGLNTQAKIAAELNVSASFVSQHLRLLKLPEGVHPYIASGPSPNGSTCDSTDRGTQSPCLPTRSRP